MNSVRLIYYRASLFNFFFLPPPPLALPRSPPPSRVPASGKAFILGGGGGGERGEKEEEKDLAGGREGWSPAIPLPNGATRGRRPFGGHFSSKSLSPGILPPEKKRTRWRKRKRRKEGRAFPPPTPSFLSYFPSSSFSPFVCRVITRYQRKKRKKRRGRGDCPYLRNLTKVFFPQKRKTFSCFRCCVGWLWCQIISGRKACVPLSSPLHVASSSALSQKRNERGLRFFWGVCCAQKRAGCEFCRSQIRNWNTNLPPAQKCWGEKQKPRGVHSVGDFFCWVGEVWSVGPTPVESNGSTLCSKYSPWGKYLHPRGFVRCVRIRISTCVVAYAGFEREKKRNARNAHII